MMDIYQMAVLFLIPRLEQVCIQYLEFKISKQNVLDALYNADKMKYVHFIEIKAVVGIKVKLY